MDNLSESTLTNLDIPNLNREQVNNYLSAINNTTEGENKGRHLDIRMKLLNRLVLLDACKLQDISHQV